MSRAPDEKVFDDFQQLFGEFFGAAPAKPHGDDLAGSLHLSLAEAVDGCRRVVEVRRPVLCTACGGSGGEGGRLACPECEGRKVLAETAGELRYARTCPRCRGAGEVPERVCRACDGGRVMRAGSLTVTVPPGVSVGQRLRLAGQGGECVGGSVGDLYLELRVTVPRGLTVDGCDLRAEFLLTPEQAAGGGTFATTGSHGDVPFVVPPGARDGTVIVVRGVGLPRPPSEAHDGHYRDAGARGDLAVTLRVAAPKPAEGPWWGTLVAYAILLLALAALVALAVLLGRGAAVLSGW